uniref:Uncharacterized protein n=1 Tax=Ochrobactrum phage ORM_20 TaxID=2985243 RepID=A0A9N6WUS3_9VIRU|nr:hypothetical protein ORM20_00007 [Ochrobactrum phage ORM_20]
MQNNPLYYVLVITRSLHKDFDWSHDNVVEGVVKSIVPNLVHTGSGAGLGSRDLEFDGLVTPEDAEQIVNQLEEITGIKFEYLIVPVVADEDDE